MDNRKRIIPAPSWYHVGQLVVLAGIFGSSSILSLASIISTGLLLFISLIIFAITGVVLLNHTRGLDYDEGSINALQDLFSGNYVYWTSVFLGTLITISAFYYGWMFTGFVWAFITVMEEAIRRTLYKISP